MRLSSWNIHKRIGGHDRRDSLTRIIDSIEAANPDLVCLREVDRRVRRSRLDDQPRLHLPVDPEPILGSGHPEFVRGCLWFAPLSVAEAATP